MITIHLDGERMEVSPGSTLGSIISHHPSGCCIGIIRPATKEQEQTGNFVIRTTAGEVTIEITGRTDDILKSPEIVQKLTLHWEDRYASAFGPFPSQIHPLRKPQVYERGDVILGCGGYEPARSYLIFSKTRHSADHGADEGGGVFAKAVSGKGVLDRWRTGDRITGIEPVISWADTSRSFTTTDLSLGLEDRMQIVTHVKIVAQGYTPNKITTEAAGSVEHMLLALRSGRFTVSRVTSTHILDTRLAGTSDIDKEYRHPRREGTVTVRTSGQLAGGVYIYREDIPSSPVHNVVGQVVHGIELVKLAKTRDLLIISVLPQRIDLLGLPLNKVKDIAAAEGISLRVDNEDGERIVVSQDPGNTLDVLKDGRVAITTAPLEKVIDIELDDEKAPVSCDIFRRITGLKQHDAGMLPVFFKFDDVVLFRSAVPAGTKINPENTPTIEVPASTLAITNDSRKASGFVGVRLSANKEFGPTSEPFEGTNILGRVIDTEKLKHVKEKENVYIREVKV
ncbi:MAG: methanogenesis marker 3 protein [Methanoregula sp.]|nr:methanogenesis marker 3 protein [Methanoregula sp.]